MFNKKITILASIIISLFIINSCKTPPKITTDKINAIWGERISVDTQQKDNLEIFLNSKLLENSNSSISNGKLYFDLIRPANYSFSKEDIIEIKSSKSLIAKYILRANGRMQTNELNVYFPCKDINKPAQYESLLKARLGLNFDLVSFYQSSGQKANDLKKVDCIASLKFIEKNKTTKEVLKQLTDFTHQLVSSATIERNYIFINDQGTTAHFDPKCMQATTLLNESEASTPISIDKLVQGGVISLPTGTGHGVKIAVLDSGISNSQNVAGGFIDLDRSQNFTTEDNIIDVVNCKNYPNAPKPDFLDGGHGQQVVKLIHTIANEATLTMLKVCNSFGECSSSNVSTALLYLRDLAQSGVKYDLINMSLGNENASFISQSILTDLFDLSPNTILVSSAGNNATDTEHYPASLANDSNFTDNILGIAAAKYISGSFVIANINTGKQVNSEITSLMAPGINLVISGSPSPLMGTSFAAPLATAIIARKKQANSSLKATDIHNQCLPAAPTCNYEMVQ